MRATENKRLGSDLSKMAAGQNVYPSATAGAEQVRGGHRRFCDGRCRAFYHCRLLIAEVLYLIRRLLRKLLYVFFQHGWYAVLFWLRSGVDLCRSSGACGRMQGHVTRGEMLPGARDDVLRS